MATIEERAFQYAYDKCGCRHCNIQCKTEYLINMDGTCDKHNAYRKLYIEIATEQRKIDIEKVIHALDKVVSKEILDELKKILNE